MTADSTPDVVVGSRWRANPPGREVVEVRRVWNYEGDPSVRAHPINGGRPLVAPIEYLIENYAKEPDHD